MREARSGCFVSHSQITTGFQPALRSLRIASRSRSTFRTNFRDQKVSFDFGV